MYTSYVIFISKVGISTVVGAYSLKIFVRKKSKSISNTLSIYYTTNNQ